MSWYSLNLGDGGAAFQPRSNLHDAWFASALAAAKVGATDYSNAIFGKTDLGARNVVIYFTPSAKSLAIAFGATPCEKPDEDGIGLEAGDARAWEIHFPGLSARREERMSRGLSPDPRH